MVKTYFSQSYFNRFHIVALVVMAIGVVFFTYNYRQQVRQGLGTPPVMEKFVIAKMYHIIEERNAMMLRAGSMLLAREVEDLGSFLVDQNGRTLYQFKNDEPAKSTCYEECADRWPYLWTTGQIAFGEGVNGDLGIIERTDGPGQVTYNDLPLYYFVDDKEPGDTNGHGVKDVWFVAEP